MISVQHNNMHLQDDLATLFSRNLTFNPHSQDAAPRHVPEPEPEPVSEPAPAPPQPIVYSISQHYHHSAHAVRPQQPQEQAPVPEEPQRRSSEPPQSEAVSAEAILRNHGVNPVTLTPAQLQLFRIADDAQKLRLLELWSICPPNNGGDIPALAWSSTTVEQEEQLAQIRYERQQQQQQQQQNHAMSLDGTTVQTADSRWASNESEPYITSGYEELMRREEERLNKERQAKRPVCYVGYSSATDPVYMGPDYAHQQQQQLAMAAQYGSFQHSQGYEVDSMDMM